MNAFARRLALGSLVLPLAAAATATAAPEPVPQAFILRLREAAPHALWQAQGRPQALSARRIEALRQAQRQRWQAAWSGAGLSAETGWRVQAVGQASLRLLPGHRLSADEARRWQAALAARPEVAWIEADRVEPRLQAALPTPNDPLFSQQWALQPAGGSNANAPDDRRRGVPGLQSAWAAGTGSAAQVVAVLDTGITAHEDLARARILPGYDMVSDWDSVRGRGLAADGDGRDNDPTDPGDAISSAQKAADPARYAGCSVAASSWHGTAVAGLIAAQSGNGLGGAGADWAARLLPVRVAGQCGATLRDIIDGMRWAAGLPVCQRWADSQDPAAGCAEQAPLNPHPARVINLSFGSQQSCGAEYQATVDELWALGVVVVAPAGNAHAEPARPANCQRVIGVAALNRDGFKANYSNFGSSLRIATVGGDDGGGRWGELLTDGGLLAPTPGGWQAQYGSSFAAPLVSATVSLMLAADPELSPAQILDGLARSARPHVGSKLIGACSVDNPGRCLCSSANCGAGILDATQAVAWSQALAAGQAWQAPNWPQEWLDTPELVAAAALGPDREATAAVTPGTGTGSEGSGGGALAPWVALAMLLAGLALRPRR